MSSSFSATPVEAALNAADKAIQEAEEALTSNCETDTCNENTAKCDTEDTDPDDLAAAFFAAQAKKKEAEGRLPIKEWTKLFPGLRLQGSSKPGESSRSVSGHDIVTDESNEGCTRTANEEKIANVHELIRKRLVESLHQEYEKTLKTDIGALE